MSSADLVSELQVSQFHVGAVIGSVSYLLNNLYVIRLF